MEWVDGTRLKSSAQGGGGREELQMVEIGVRCSLEQMLEEGYYHSDPHPGNLFKMRNGRLAYIDFGMMGEIEGSIRRCVTQASHYVVCAVIQTCMCVRLSFVRLQQCCVLFSPFLCQEGWPNIFSWHAVLDCGRLWQLCDQRSLRINRALCQRNAVRNSCDEHTPHAVLQPRHLH